MAPFLRYPGLFYFQWVENNLTPACSTNLYSRAPDTDKALIKCEETGLPVLALTVPYLLLREHMRLILPGA